MQFPEKGTYTKFKKRAITSLYNIPELLQVVKEWDNFVRSVSAPWSTWYPRYDSTGKSFKNYAPETKDRDKAFQNIGSMTRQFYKDQKKLCILADVDYKGAHAFRHGHAHFGLSNAKTPQDMKAVSQNLMHKSTAITDEIYSRMTAADTNKVITQLGTNTSQNVNPLGLTPADILASMSFEEKMKLLGLIG